MRSFAWLICLVGCGRIGFSAPPNGDRSGDLMIDDAGDALVTIDPATLPPFGVVRRVSELSADGADDDDPCLSRDQLEIFFDSARSGNDDLWTAHRDSLLDPWSAPVQLANVNTAAAEEHPALSRDALTLYFTSDRNGTPDVWFSIRPDRSAPFAPPIEVANVNSGSNDLMGSVDALDQGLFLSSTRNAASDQLYEARRANATQAWSVPVRVAEIVTTVSDPSAHVDDRGLALYLVRYSSDADLAWTTRSQVGASWVTPVALGELNTTSNESDPWLSPDLRTIYFVRDTGVTTKDLFMATR